MNEKPKKRGLLKRIIMITLVAFVSLIVVSIVLFRIYKNDIAKAILIRANTAQQGELVFQDIAFNPFIHFPDISIALNSVEYFEIKRSAVPDSLPAPIIQLNALYLSFDILDLLQKNVNVSKIHLAQGKVSLITYADSSLNFTNALGDSDNDALTSLDTVADKSTPFDLNIYGLDMEDITISYSNVSEGLHSRYTIINLNASFNYLPATIKTSVNADILIDKLKIAETIQLKDKKVNLITSLDYDRSSKQLQIDPSQLNLGRASFKTEGSIQLVKNGLIDIKLKGDDGDFSMLQVIFSKGGLENITRGELYFDGSIKGSFQSGIPLMQCTFGVKDVSIDIPNTKQKIENLALSGSFISGVQRDFSGASVNLKDIQAGLPDGELKGNASIEDFTNPKLMIDIYLKSNIAGFENILDLGNLDSLSGILEMKTNFDGHFEVAGKKFQKNRGEATFRFDSISFVIPKVNTLRNIYGRIDLKDDSLRFQDLRLNFGKSDFDINGKIGNVLSLITGSEDTISGKLHIKSQRYDFPDFFTWDQKVATAFPYLIKDVNLFVKPTTTSAQLTNFIRSPHIDFDITHLDAEIKGFLPPVTIRSGLFILGEKDSSLYLNFKHFDIELAGSKLSTNMIYTSPKTNPDWFSIQLIAEDLHPAKVFVEWFEDSVPGYLNGRLDGQFDLDMTLSNDSLINFDQLNLKAHKLDYVNSTDTFDIYQMEIQTKNISYDLEKSENFLEHLSLEMKLIADTVSTNYFKVDKVDDDIYADRGEFHIVPNNSQFFDKKAKGDILLKPFNDLPSYRFRYAVDQFDVASLFSTFLEDTLVIGKMDIDLDLEFAGTGWDEVRQNLNGKVFMYGKDLTLVGVDLDKVIQRFERSQRFTLADVGAVLLLGPAGILVTKGSDYASLVVLNPGDSCEVREASSKWEITNGVVNLSDVAISTNENRMAAKGTINIAKDSLDVHLALLNKKGCVVFGQRLNGNLRDPNTGKLKMLKSVVAPVTNLVKTATSADCEVFYNGSVKQPEEK